MTSSFLAGVTSDHLGIEGTLCTLNKWVVSIENHGYLPKMMTSFSMNWTASISGRLPLSRKYAYDISFWQACNSDRRCVAWNFFYSRIANDSASRCFLYDDRVRFSFMMADQYTGRMQRIGRNDGSTFSGFQFDLSLESLGKIEHMLMSYDNTWYFSNLVHRHTI